MAKESGLGATISIDDSGGTARDLSNDITSASFATPRGVQDVTGVDVSAHERILLLADHTAEFAGPLNDASNQSHAVLSTITSTSVERTVSFAVSGQTLASEMLGTTYDFTRSETGEFTWTSSFSLADGSVPTWA